MGLITEATESVSNSRDSRPTIIASERVLNGAILAAEISESYEEHLEIFDHFYADDIHATVDGLKEPVPGKAAVRARLARGFPCSASRVRRDWRRLGLDSVEPARQAIDSDETHQRVDAGASRRYGRKLQGNVVLSTKVAGGARCLGTPL